MTDSSQPLKFIFEKKEFNFEPIPKTVRLAEWDEGIFLRSTEPARNRPKSKGEGFDGTYAAACKHCNETFMGRKENLQSHVEFCPNIDHQTKIN